MISVYDSKCIDFNNNGLVVLNECISCTIEEELNGTYEATIEHPIDERGKWKELLEGNIIKADGQLFRVYRKAKTLKGIKIYARHIFYDLLNNFLEDVRPTNLGGADALYWVLYNTQYMHPFTCGGNVEGPNTRYFIRKNPVEAIMGADGIINNWGGEIVRNNFDIQLLNARGSDKGFLISYGKNIEGIEETLDMDSVCTRMMPKGANELLLPERYVDSQYINNYPHPIIKMVEFSNIGVSVENGITEEMAIVLLRESTQQQMLTSKIDIPKSNYKINLVELEKTEEYKNYSMLQKAELGDIVTIKHSKLNINLKQKVIKTKKNILTGRLEGTELGDFKANIATSINSVGAKVDSLAQKVEVVVEDVGLQIANISQNLIIDVHNVSDKVDSLSQNIVTKNIIVSDSITGLSSGLNLFTLKDYNSLNLWTDGEGSPLNLWTSKANSHINLWTDGDNSSSEFTTAGVGSHIGMLTTGNESPIELNTAGTNSYIRLYSSDFIEIAANKKLIIKATDVSIETSITTTSDVNVGNTLKLQPRPITANDPNPPTAIAGRIYFDGVDFKFCGDGTAWNKLNLVNDKLKLPILAVPPTAEAGTIYFDGTNFKACKNGIDWVTII